MCRKSSGNQRISLGEGMAKYGKEAVPTQERSLSVPSRQHSRQFFADLKAHDDRTVAKYILWQRDSFDNRGRSAGGCLLEYLSHQTIGTNPPIACYLS